MITITKIGSRQLQSHGLDDLIIEFDRENMGDILAREGMPFPEERRRKGFEGDATFHLAFDGQDQIAGYLEYCLDWNDPKAIYISSLQIAPPYRNTKLLLRLLQSGAADLKQKTFTSFKSHVQPSNTRAIRIYRKLGFRVSEEKEAGRRSYPVIGDPTILESPFANELLQTHPNRWHIQSPNAQPAHRKPV